MKHIVTTINSYDHRPYNVQPSHHHNNKLSLGTSSLSYYSPDNQTQKGLMVDKAQG